jgi:hypothetical protein
MSKERNRKDEEVSNQRIEFRGANRISFPRESLPLGDNMKAIVAILVCLVIALLFRFAIFPVDVAVRTGEHMHVSIYIWSLGFWVFAGVAAVIAVVKFIGVIRTR